MDQTGIFLLTRQWVKPDSGNVKFVTRQMQLEETSTSGTIPTNYSSKKKFSKHCLDGHRIDSSLGFRQVSNYASTVPSPPGEYWK